MAKCLEQNWSEKEPNRSRIGDKIENIYSLREVIFENIYSLRVIPTNRDNFERNISKALNKQFWKVQTNRDNFGKYKLIETILESTN